MFNTSMETIALFLLFLEISAPARDEDFNSPGYREINRHTFYCQDGYFKSVRDSGEKDVENNWNVNVNV